MNKVAKALTCAALSSAMLFTVACHKQSNDPETRALSLSISAVDGVFNPFFYTSLTDGKVISMTQASLITSDLDANGKPEPVAGDKYPTVAKDFEIKYYNAPSGGTTCTSAEAAANGRTEYSFLIKKGLKFSDGYDLTIKDVLFNFYVYLDPVYTGSNTMYSVDIQGLHAYQENNAALGDGDGGSSSYTASAQERLRELINYGLGEVDSLSEQGEKDYKYVQGLFKKELESDWNNMVSSWQETYKVNYTFTKAWQAYLFQEGIVTAQRRQYPNGTIREIRVDEGTKQEIDPTVAANKEAYANGKVLTTLDQWADGAYGGDYPRTGAQTYIDEIGELTTDEKLNAYMSEHNCDKETAELDITKEYCIESVYAANLGDKTGLDEVLTYWATASTAYSDFVADERGKALESSDNPQYFISGIRTEKTNNFKGQDLGETYDVLKIIVNRVDPAAIWQFGITVAPLHYYSGTWENKNYVDDFNGDAISDYTGRGDENTCFGVKRGDFNFFQSVIRGEKKSGVPVGAGPYKASKENGGNPSGKSEFLDNNIIYYERNDNFHTMGAQIDNAKIRLLKYKVVDESRIITSVEGGQLDYGEPNATALNLAEVESKPNIFGVSRYDTNGYGYVGVNPTYVPDIGIRRIIMHAMNIGLSIDYYGTLGRTIYRPMSVTSWAYPLDITTPYYENWDSNKIKEELGRLGYHDGGDGVYVNDNPSSPYYGERLKYTFTIAGANTDHPAYNMFNDAADVLNGAGFEISVSNDPNALLKLTSGGLTVWAAAWSSGIDPDMYQVYHKDSNATSTLNWGYKTILNDTTGKYSEELTMIETLSGWIEEARATLEQSERKTIYAKCLDKIMELAVELPVYQRKDLCVYNINVLDPATLNQNPNATIGLIDRIWEVNYK